MIDRNIFVFLQSKVAVLRNRVASIASAVCIRKSYLS